MSTCGARSSLPTRNCSCSKTAKETYKTPNSSSKPKNKAKPPYSNRFKANNSNSNHKTVATKLSYSSSNATLTQPNSKLCRGKTKLLVNCVKSQMRFRLRKTNKLRRCQLSTNPSGTLFWGSLTKLLLTLNQSKKSYPRKPKTKSFYHSSSHRNTLKTQPPVRMTSHSNNKTLNSPTST